MLLIPAIDLKDGHCVRLQQGDMAASTTFGEDPGAMARRWLDAGALRLHLVDLNGAFAGKPVNEAAVKAILREVGGQIPVQLGGGIRDLDTIERYLDDAISSISLGMISQISAIFTRLLRIGIYTLVFEQLSLFPEQAWWNTWYGYVLALVF